MKVQRSLRRSLPAAAALALSLSGCNSSSSTSNVKDLAAPTLVDANAASATVAAPIQFPLVDFFAEGIMTGSQFDSCDVHQSLEAATNDQAVAFVVAGYQASTCKHYTSDVNKSLKSDNYETLYNRLDTTTLLQIEASNPTYKSGDGALIYISSIDSPVDQQNLGGQIHYVFSTPVPLMPIPSSVGSYSSITASGLTFPTVIKSNTGKKNAQVSQNATVTVRNMTVDPASVLIRVTLDIPGDKKNNEKIPFAYDAYYTIDPVGERITRIWTLTQSPKSTTKMSYVLCKSTLPDAGDPANLDNSGTCHSIEPAVTPPTG